MSQNNTPSPFTQWLSNELETRQWSVSKLAAEAELSPSSISRVLNTHYKPGPQFCRNIARAFAYSEILVFQKAGLLSENIEPDAPQLDAALKASNLKQLISLFETLTPDQRESIVNFAAAFNKENRQT